MKSVPTTGLYALLAVAQPVFGLVVPESLPDGVWAISFDPTSGQTRKILEASSTQHLSTRHHLARRQSQPPPLENPRTACISRGLDRDTFNQAKESFEKTCDIWHQYPENSAVVITNQGSIAYMCNFASANRCWREEYEEASSLMDKQCGNTKAATVYVDRWKKTYGRDMAGADICL